MDKNKIKECEEWLTRSKKASEERIANLEGLKQQLEDMAEPELGVESETADALSENVNQRVQDLLRQVEAITNELEREMQEKRRSHELQMRQLLDEQAELHKQMVQQTEELGHKVKAIQYAVQHKVIFGIFPFLVICGVAFFLVHRHHSQS